MEATQPPVIVAVGTLALEWCLEQKDMAKWRGRFVPIKVGSHKCWMYPIYHPKDVLSRQRTSANGNIIPTEWDQIFAFDLKVLFESA
jgi:uracil-DNA glycosylase